MSKPISLKLPQELCKEIDKVKDELFQGNRTALITKALEQYFERLYGTATEADTQNGLIIEKALSIAIYIKLIIMNGDNTKELLAKEVSELCLLLNKKTES